ncbi:helix-turn-helix domain-containing protein [Arthrobacter sp. NPDC090010]|uniref:helix-turn-helix domain-containing protein n=1 Tax=Arthrobacter sp. NPDC090010 TaxID=3363942 RepID=UPI003815032B
MTIDADTLAAAIGARVRQERQAHGWTLDQLSETAGISRRMLVNVEQGAANPSIATLLRLSDALGVGLPALVEPPQSHGVKVIRSGDGAVLWTGEHGGRGVLMVGTASPDVMELWDWVMKPGESLSSEPHAPGTKELLHLMSGELTVTVSGEPHVLEAGDAFSFSGDVEHSYAATGPEPARFAMSVFEPGVGAGHHRSAGAPWV